MSQLDPASALPILFLIHGLGLVSAFLARINRNAPRRQLFAALFLVALVAVGGSTLAAEFVKHSPAWLMGGASLAIMVTLVVWEHPAENRDFS